MGVRKRKSLGKSQVCPTEYKEKIWGKEEGGEFIIDGYVFRGKKAFSKAVEGLRELMKKGVNKDVNQVKIKVLDVRKNGAGTDIEIEMVENNAKEHETRLDTIEDVNEKLIGDIKTFNDIMLESLPKAIIKKNEELMETLNLLHTVIDIYKQAEIDAEEESETCAEGNDDLNELTKQNFFQCKD